MTARALAAVLAVGVLAVTGAARRIFRRRFLRLSTRRLMAHLLSGFLVPGEQGDAESWNEPLKQQHERRYEEVSVEPALR